MPVYKYRWWIVYILTNPLHDHDIIKEYDLLKEPSNPHEAELLWRVRHSHGNIKECQILKIARSYQHVGEMGSGCMAWFDTSKQLKEHICIIDRSKISKLPLIPIDPCEKCGDDLCIWNSPKNPKAHYLCTNGFHHACEPCKTCKKTCKYPYQKQCELAQLKDLNPYTQESFVNLIEFRHAIILGTTIYLFVEKDHIITIQKGEVDIKNQEFRWDDIHGVLLKITPKTIIQMSISNIINKYHYKGNYTLFYNTEEKKWELFPSLL